MNRIFRFEMTVKTGLIITLLLAVVMAAGCRKKQDDTFALPASDKKSPKQDTQIKSPPVEANAPNVVTLPAEPAVDKKETTADKTPPKVADTKPAMQQEAPSPQAPSPPQLKAPPMPEPADLKPLESLKTADEKIDFITEYADEHPESAAAMVYNVLDDNDVEVRTAAIEMLVANDLDDSNVVFVADKALKDSDPQVRQSAVEACTPITDPAVKNVLLEAIADSSEDVRAAAVQLADQKEPLIRMEVLKTGIASQYEDVKEAVVSSLTDISSPAAMDILITGLKDANPDFRDEVKSAISLLISQDFDTYDQAQKWWNANRSKFDDELTEQE